MKITYRVIDKTNGLDITDDYCWVITPDGSLAYNDFGDLTKVDFVKVIIDIKED